MKQLIYLLFFLFSGITVQAQTVILNVIQNYSIPEIPTITQNTDTLMSSIETGNQWYKNGEPLLGETKQTLVITHSGEYSVIVTNSFGCSSQSEIFQAIKTDIAIIQTYDFSYNIFPNPNNGLFTVEVKSDKTDLLILELLTISGKSVVKMKTEHTQGTQRYQFGKRNIVDGIYTLKIVFGSQRKNQKLIINNISTKNNSI